MLINFSNHPYKNWSEKQKNIASKWGEVVDRAFPQVSAQADELEIEKMAQNEVNEILIQKPDVVMCQGEFTLTYLVVKKLLENDVKVVSACSERNTKEVFKDGISKKESIFEFVRFREYGV